MYSIFGATKIAIVSGVCLLGLFLAPFHNVFALVNINTAGISELDSLSGIGPAKAQAIIDHREENGLFSSTADIVNVTGIGQATYQEIKDDITIGGVSNGNEDDTQKDDPDQDDSDTTKDEQDRASSSNRPDIDVIANISLPATEAVVGMPIVFEGYPGASEQTHKPSFRWNFGDGSTGRGSVISHTYSQPGSYVVSLIAERYGEKQDDMITITVVEADIVITKSVPGFEGYVEIENQTSVHTDISNWRLGYGIEWFVFPPRSYLAAKSTMSIPNDLLPFDGVSYLILKDVQGGVVSEYPGRIEQVPDSFYKSMNSSVREVATEEEIESEDSDQEKQDENLVASAGRSTSEEGPSVWLWIAGLLGIMVVAAGSLLTIPRQKNKKGLSADDIEIIE